MAVGVERTTIPTLATAGAVDPRPIAVIEGEQRPGRAVIVCDHASNFVPAEFADLGLSASDLTRHIAWDPGALGVARDLAERLDAPLAFSTVSRLIVDLNRTDTDDDAIAVVSETTRIPGNQDLSAAARRDRFARFHAPYHARLADLMATRAARPASPVVIAVHTFNPVYRGVARPWAIGVLYGERPALGRALIAALRADDPALVVGDNEPYSPADRVYRTLERHADGHGFDSVMIEIRNDLVADAAGEAAWAARLARLLAPLLETGRNA